MGELIKCNTSWFSYFLCNVQDRLAQFWLADLHAKYGAARRGAQRHRPPFSRAPFISLQLLQDEMATVAFPARVERRNESSCTSSSMSCRCCLSSTPFALQVMPEAKM